MMLEERSHSHSSFITLTYRDEEVPQAICDGNHALVLRPKDLTLFIKRWRKLHGPIRFFAVGEYGSPDHTSRPHYHAVMYGVPPTPETEDKVLSTWGKGHITVAPLEKERILYCAYYTVKKWTKPGIDELYGRPAEFSRQSRRPGIGALAIPYLASLYERRDGSFALAERGDVYPTTRIEGKQWPLDKYMLTKLREYVNIPVLARDRTENKPFIYQDYEQAAKREKQILASERPHGAL